MKDPCTAAVASPRSFPAKLEIQKPPSRHSRGNLHHLISAIGYRLNPTKSD
jgi:hypothetical protein